MRQIEAGRATARVPAAVAAEIVLLRELGRIGIGLAELKTAMEKAPSLRFLPLDLAQVNEFAAHSGVRDPFDQIFILFSVHAAL